MNKQNLTKWLLILVLILPLILVACGGTEEATEEPAATEAVAEEPEATEAVAEEPAATEAVAEEPTEEMMATEEPMEEPTEEMMATEEPMEEATEEPMEEPMAEFNVDTNGFLSCQVAEDGAFAGINPAGQTILWWHNHSGSRGARLQVLVSQFNATNECIEKDADGNPVMLDDDTERVLYDFELDAEGKPARDADGNLILTTTSLAGTPKRIYIDAQNQGSYNDIRDKFNASIAAGELPAALLVGYQNDQAFYQLNDGLADLNTFLDDTTWGLSPETQADFYSSFFNQSISVIFDDQRLGFPPNRSMEVMYYNQTWLEELGFSGPPTTPEEFQEMACAAAAANGDGTGGYVLRDDASAVASWTYAFGGDVLIEDGTQYAYNTEATLNALAFLKQLYDDGCAYFLTEGFPDPEFAARRAIFTQGSSSGIPFYASGVSAVAEENGTDPDVWGVIAIPHTTPDPVQNIYGGDIMISATTPEQQLGAWAFIKWFTTPEVQGQWVQISGYFPTREATNEFLGGYDENSPQWGQARDLLPYAYYEPQLISYQSVRDAVQEAFNVVMQLAEGWTTDDIQDILDELTDTANELQEELMSEAGG